MNFCYEMEQISKDLKPLLKKCGYKKNRLLWYKEKEEFYVIFYIQNSVWSNRVWYYGFGTIIKGIDYIIRPSIADIHIHDRIDNTIKGRQLKPEEVFQLVCYWEREYASTENIVKNAQSRMIPRMSGLKCRAWIDDLLNTGINQNDDRYSGRDIDWTVVLTENKD